MGISRVYLTLILTRNAHFFSQWISSRRKAEAPPSAKDSASPPKLRADGVPDGTAESAKSFWQQKTFCKQKGRFAFAGKHAESRQLQQLECKPEHELGGYKTPLKTPEAPSRPFTLGDAMTRARCAFLLSPAAPRKRQT
ncbi:hypothetical protein, conserved [Eimeria tenella]|uniref:Uncharacterized protein n=1 Tax=Eimeria tenella TaxID=5802 RepID=U6KK51_EIMTE|nr:hypothetical protein, conserved [Eimeria tenella]CDJ37196.1 hypothetical protein, conserved [Eimeria tenella]|eukprot:XP_013228034.1 hypothetical protein, conserved [Eimeria tenella]